MAEPTTSTFRPHPPVVIGLVGGVAAGKSTVAQMFGEHGIAVLDADRQAREVVERPAVQQQLRAVFGDSVFAADGQLRRDALAARVFTDDAARATLEAITHPAIREALLAAIAAARKRGDSVVLDVPLLVERGLIDACDACIFIEAAMAARTRRAAARGWDRAELRRREAAQAPLPDKKSRCAYIIRNDRPLEDVRRQVAEVLQLLQQLPRSE